MGAGRGLGRYHIFDQHDGEISKIAVVGDEKWRDFAEAFLAKGFRQAAVEYFLTEDLAKARAWLEADSR